MGRPDALSRQVDHLKGADDNADCTLLTPEVFKSRVTEAVTLEGKEAAFLEHIQQSDQYNDLVVKALKALDTGELCSNEWTWKVLSCIEAGSTSQTTPSSVMT